MSLLRELQQITERTYQKFSGVNLEEFIIGKKRFLDLSKYCSYEILELSDAARVFLRTINDNLYLAIYFSTPIISILEKHDPRKGLSEKNIYPFMVFIEEINHGIHAALKYLSGDREIQEEEFIRDLELQAKIDAYQTLKFFLAYFNPSKKLEKFDRLWLRYHLFERQNHSYANRILTDRYQETSYLGEKYVRFLDSVPPKHRVEEIRRFRGMSYDAKADYIRMLP